MIYDENSIVSQILELSARIFEAVSPEISPEWLSSDLTLSQLRVLLILQTHGPSRMSVISNELKVTLPTVTGIVDNLVKKGLILRETDVQDRRLVICKLSIEGKQVVNALWRTGEYQFENLLEGLTREELEKSAEVARILLKNILRKNTTGKS